LDLYKYNVDIILIHAIDWHCSSLCIWLGVQSVSAQMSLTEVSRGVAQKLPIKSPDQIHRPNQQYNHPRVVHCRTNPGMDDTLQLNLRVLARHNKHITSLIDKSSYCVIYTFSIASSSWTKAGYEGTLFIYTQQPHIVQTEDGERLGGEYGFCVLNRLNLENFWGEINGGDIVLDDQFIITRSLTGGKSTQV
jgi:hypothetical protein